MTMDVFFVIEEENKEEKFHAFVLCKDYMKKKIDDERSRRKISALYAITAR